MTTGVGESSGRAPPRDVHYFDDILPEVAEGVGSGVSVCVCVCICVSVYLCICVSVYLYHSMFQSGDISTVSY